MAPYTPLTAKLIATATNQAKLSKRNYVGVDHLLLGMLQLGEGGGIALLSAMKVSLETLRLSLEQHAKKETGEKNSHHDDIPFTGQVKQILILAMQEAYAQRSKTVDTEHILLAFLIEDKSAAAQALKRLGANLESARLHQNRMGFAGDSTIGVGTDRQQKQEISSQCWDKLEVITDGTLQLDELARLLDLSGSVIKGLLKLKIRQGRFSWRGRVDNLRRRYVILTGPTGETLTYYSDTQLMALVGPGLTHDIATRHRLTPPLPLLPR